MVGDEAPPGAVERALRRIPDGFVLRTLFYALLALSVGVIGNDYRTMLVARADVERSARTEPMPMRLPEPGDQVRPYLPQAIPVGPDRGEPRLPGYEGPVGGEAMNRPMRFLLAGEGTATAFGRIDIGTAKDLDAFLGGEGKGVRRLVLHSPGGSVADAIAMARAVREKRVDTEVPADGYCASACPLVLAGGRHRTVGEDAWVGLHQVYAVDIPGQPRVADRDRSIAEIQATIAECQQLLLDMGVSTDVWIKAMRTPADALYVLTRDELTASEFVTRPVQGPPMPDWMKRTATG